MSLADSGIMKKEISLNQLNVCIFFFSASPGEPARLHAKKNYSRATWVGTREKNIYSRVSAKKFLGPFLPLVLCPYAKNKLFIIFSE